MTSKNIENRIARINATMDIEDKPLPEDVKELLRKINAGNLSNEEAKKIIFNKYNLA